jgi:hypothetical protein
MQGIRIGGATLLSLGVLGVVSCAPAPPIDADLGARRGEGDAAAPPPAGGPWTWRLHWTFDGLSLAGGCAAAGAGAEVVVLVGEAGKDGRQAIRRPCAEGRLEVALATEYVGTALLRLVRGGRLLYETSWSYGDVHQPRSIALRIWYPEPARVAIPLCTRRPPVGVDALAVETITVEGKTLLLSVRDRGGGCRGHLVTLCRDERWSASAPPEVALQVGHRTLGNGCAEDYAYDLPFDLGALIEDHRTLTGGVDPTFAVRVEGSTAATVRY